MEDGSGDGDGERGWEARMENGNGDEEGGQFRRRGRRTIEVNGMENGSGDESGEQGRIVPVK